MSVSLIDNKSFFGYRVRRSVNGETVQQYYSLVRDSRRLAGWERDRVYRAAKNQDRILERKQREAARDREKELKHTTRIQAGSGVRGISLREKVYRKAGKRYTSLNFVVSCHSEIQDKPVNTSFSVTKNGWEGAWRKAVQYLANHKRMFRYRHLLERMPPNPSAE